MNVEFFGVRGSIATAGEETRRYGGNTSCVLVRAGDATIVLDAGTGIRRAGARLREHLPATTHLFLSHLHWDHIQGFPFFAPAFVPQHDLRIYGVRCDDQGPSHDPTTVELSIAAGVPMPDPSVGVRAALSAQMMAPNFPIGLSAMRARLQFIDVELGRAVHISDDVVVRHLAVDHPNGCVAYRIDHAGRSVVYATDLELADGVDGLVFTQLAHFARGADVIIFDAMYTPEEYHGIGMPSRRGYGHSTFEMGAALATAAAAKQLVLFHHDPAHDDEFMDKLAARAQAVLPQTVVAREGMVLTLERIDVLADAPRIAS